MKWLSLVPGVGPLAAAGIGAHAGLFAKPEPLEPEIPSAMDDWDRDFELATGCLPSFSRLRVHQKAGVAVGKLPATIRFKDCWIENRVVRDDGEPKDALAFAGKRR